MKGLMGSKRRWPWHPERRTDRRRLTGQRSKVRQLGGLQPREAQAGGGPMSSTCLPATHLARRCLWLLGTTGKHGAGTAAGAAAVPDTCDRTSGWRRP